MSEKKDREIFTPDQDFPVVHGDTGKVYRTPAEIWDRTPGKENFRSQNIQNQFLLGELQELEEKQSDVKYRHYKKYRSRLGSISEKIYFLSLTSLKARDEYLFARGLTRGGFSPDEKDAIRQREIILGMSKDAVVDSWGRPSQVDIAGDPKYENERWAFYERGKIKYIYFEGGRVQGWNSN